MTSDWNIRNYNEVFYSTRGGYTGTFLDVWKHQTSTGQIDDQLHASMRRGAFNSLISDLHASNLERRARSSITRDSRAPCQNLPNGDNCHSSEFETKKTWSVGLEFKAANWTIGPEFEFETWVWNKNLFVIWANLHHQRPTYDISGFTSHMGQPT